MKVNSAEDEKVEQFRKLACERLLKELEETKRNRQEILRELQEYASLLLIVRNMQTHKSEKINIRASLGHQVFVNAEVEKKDTIVVKLAADLFAELKLERAEVFVTARMEILKQRADLCVRLMSNIRATMQYIMAALAEYDKLAKK